MSKSKHKFYAIAAGGQKRIFESWTECERFRDTYPHGARYKGFATREEAERFLDPSKYPAFRVAQAAATEGESKSTKADKPKAFYAVRAGLTPGVYETWAECYAQVEHYPKAEYKKFKTHEDAEQWLDGDTRTKPLEGKTALAYCDGSYNIKTGVWGYGVLIMDTDNSGAAKKYDGYGTEYNDARNVAGEVRGAVRAVQETLALGYENIILRYDYEGIKRWATGQWKANLPLTQGYKKAMTELGKRINIRFEKVDAHTGERYNELVDKLAKRAAGIN